MSTPIATRARGRHRAREQLQSGTQLLLSCRPGSDRLVRLALWTLIEAAPAAVSGLAVAHAVDAFRAGSTGTAVLWLGVFAAAIAGSGVATRGVYRALAPAIEDTRDRLTERLVRGSVATIATTGRTGSAPLTQLLDQVDQLRNLLSAIARNARTTAAPLIAALSGVFALSPQLGIVVTVPVALAVLLYAILLPRMVTAERAAAVADEELGDAATGVFGSSDAITGLGARQWAVVELTSAAATTGRADLRVAALHAWRHLVIAIGGYLPLILVILVSAPLLRGGSVGIGEVAGAVTYILTGLLPALSASVTGVGGWFVQVAVLLGRLLPVARTEDPKAITHPPGPVPSAAVSAQQLCFSYRAGARPIIDSLDLAVRPGELLALVGPSGAGKTTFAHLLTGLLPPTGGRIGTGTVGGPLLIPQTGYVCRGSVRENLGYLTPIQRPDGDLWLAIDAVGLRVAVQRWGGLDAILLDGVSRPTPSEAQRLVLARSWLSEAQVLVLDEAWSLLDEADRHHIERWLRADGRTLVVISHHLDILARADQVAYFDGRQVSVGTSRELTATCAGYCDLLAFDRRTRTDRTAPSTDPTQVAA